MHNFNLQINRNLKKLIATIWMIFWILLQLKINHFLPNNLLSLLKVQNMVNMFHLFLKIDNQGIYNQVNYKNNKRRIIIIRYMILAIYKVSNLQKCLIQILNIDQLFQIFLLKLFNVSINKINNNYHSFIILNFLCINNFSIFRKQYQ